MIEKNALAGVDLDHCRDPETGAIAPWAQAIVDRMQTYTEASPSGTGLRLFLQGKRPKKGRRKGHIEIYSWGRYLTITGQHIEGTPTTIEPRQAELEAFESELAPIPKAKTSQHTPPPHGAGPYLTDDALLEKALAARNGQKFARLWSGDTSDYGGDDSRADLALCGELAFWTQDAAQIDRLFRGSGLYREKWERTDYRNATITKALSQTTEHWTPPRPRSNGDPLHTSPTSENSSNGSDPHTQGETRGPEPEHFTDLGNARRLVRLFGSDLRYCHDWRQWLIWDTTRWRQDRNGEIVRRAKRTVQALYSEAATIEDKDERKAAAKWALTSESDGRIQAMINLATSEPGIPVLPEDLDADPWLLNCRNGTVNLRTGKLQGHRREDLLTKRAPVLYDPDATCPEWTRFLQQIFLEKSDLIAFVRRAIGYSLTADVKERVLFIAHGKGRNGKSTLLELIAEMLGDYSLRTPTETLMVKPYHQIPNDLAQLPGRRFVHASESEEGKRLSESLIKDLTGRDTISARFMRGEFFQFQPVCKLWLRTNHKPVIRGTDNAIWDRIRLIPFDLRIGAEQEDHGLPERLRAELPGVLGWAVTGCLSWQINGLGLPKEVKTANEAYRAEMDVLAAFLDDCCLLKPDAETTSKALFDAYVGWCERNGERELPRRAFTDRLQERGFQPARIGHHRIRGWRGIGLGTPAGKDASAENSQC